MAIIGIDLGTTNSLASVWRDGKIELIPNSLGEYLTPSVVSFGDDNEVYIGKVAKEMLITRPDRTFSEFKRDMGTDKRYQVGETTYRPEELSAFVLRRLKEDAERFLGEPVTEAVISVPAYFNDDKRCATKAAGMIAGLHVERLVNEPSAVALKHHSAEKDMETFIIFDFGGGTLDVSLVEAFENMVEIQAVSGDNYLGGKDFNHVIAEHFCKENHMNPKELRLEDWEIVLKEAELLKKQLSESQSATRSLLLQHKEYRMSLDNQQLIHISMDLFKRMIKPIQKVINDVNYTWEDIDKVILVGGSSKMPVVSQYLAQMCKTEVICDDNPDESIAMGVGMAAAIKERKGDIKDMILADICPFSLGIAVRGNTFSPIIERNETLPCSRTHTYTTMHDNQKTLAFHIFQGESLIADENLLLGTLELTDLPQCKAGEVVADVTFMYDINGILDVKIKGADQTLHKVIMNKNIRMSEEELQRYLEKLEQVTMSPREHERNRLLLEQARRLYEECNPKYRQMIAEEYERFEIILESHDNRAIREAYVRMMLMLQAIEASKVHFEDFDTFWEADEEE